MAGLPPPPREFSPAGCSGRCRDKSRSARRGQGEGIMSRRKNRTFFTRGFTPFSIRGQLILWAPLILIGAVFLLATAPTATVVPSPVVGQWTTMPYRVGDLVVLEATIPQPLSGATETVKVYFYAQWGSIALCAVSEWDRVPQKDGSMKYTCHWNPELTHVARGTTVTYWYDVFDSAGRSRRGETITAVLP